MAQQPCRAPIIVAVDNQVAERSGKSTDPEARGMDKLNCVARGPLPMPRATAPTTATSSSQRRILVLTTLISRP